MAPIARLVLSPATEGNATSQTKAEAATANNVSGLILDKLRLPKRG
jgi:hypothetical protein